MKETNRGPLLF